MLKKYFVLLIEDDEDFSSIIQTALGNAKFEVTLAQDGLEGLKKAQMGGYDLILLDLMLPRFSGIDILRTLKNNPPIKANGPIVIVSNVMEGAEIQRERTLERLPSLQKT